jgi:site-specific DNA recombinase
MRMAQLSAEVGARHAAYGRLSLETEDTTSPVRQKQICGRRIEERNGVYDPEVDYYEDIDKSGFDEAIDRDGFNRLLENLHLYDTLVVYRLDRLTRRLTKFAELLKKLKENNVTLVSATEPFDTSDPMGQAMVWIIMVFAELESETIGARMQSAQNFMVRNGKYRGGQRPFGWKKGNTEVAGGVYLERNEPEATTLFDGIMEIMAGKSIRSVCVDWNEDGILTTRGNAWAQGTLSQMLRNPILKGHGIFGETVLRDADGKPIQVAEPLIDEIVWTKLQHILEKRGRGGGRDHKGLSLLGGIATCCFCKRPLRASSRSYVCPSFSDAHRGKGTASTKKRDCVGVCIDRAKLDAWVLVWVTEQLSADWIRKAQADAENAFAERAAANNYQEKRDELSRKLDRLEEDRYEGMYDTIEERGRFKKRRAEIIDELVALDEAHAAPEDFTAFELPLTIDELQGKDITEVRLFLMSVIGKLEVRKGTRGSRRPVSDRLDAALVEALQGGARSGRRSQVKAQVS